MFIHYEVNIVKGESDIKQTWRVLLLFCVIFLLVYRIFSNFFPSNFQKGSLIVTDIFLEANALSGFY